MKKIIIISDTHGLHRSVNLPEGDILIHCGDFMNSGRSFEEAFHYTTWIKENISKYDHVLQIGGNHDIMLQTQQDRILDHMNDVLGSKFVYLEDSGVTIDGINFYGSPWTPTFFNWAFMLDRGEQIRNKWKQIPDDTHVLITHGPRHGVLDRCDDGFLAGCEDLGHRIDKLGSLRLHCFGHIHEGYSYKIKSEIEYVNASICTSGYTPTNKPVVIELD